MPILHSEGKQQWDMDRWCHNTVYISLYRAEKQYMYLTLADQNIIKLH